MADCAFSFHRATSLGEGKTLNSKSQGVLFGEWCSILLLSAHPKRVTGPTQAPTTINKK